MQRYRKILIPMIATWLLLTIRAEAVYEDIPSISMSRDGNAFTTHAGEKDTDWYEKGTEVYTGIKGSLKEPGIGEHYYRKFCSGKVPVERWKVNWEEAKCIHNQYPSENVVYGEAFGRQCCKTPYYSGWLAYCADCKEQIVYNYIYMSAETAKSMTYMDLSKAYFYKCPHCNNLEMAVQFEAHECKDVSANRYFVRYHANMGSGYMEKSMHMVNNESVYEGQQITPQTKLNLNTYTQKGYVFAGWNTKADGSGEYFEDGAEIFNLSLEQNANVILYAQWRKSVSVLEIDPAGGSYKGESGITRIEGGYTSEYHIRSEELVAPTGNTVSFDTQGGEKVAERTNEKVFTEWICRQPFYGVLEGNIYDFAGDNGSVDRLTACYEDRSIVLPEAKREGYSFGGWYADAACTIPIGKAGDSYIPARDITLYAGWTELLLRAEDNYSANQGKGAVDLNWEQKDELDKVYQVYQRTEETDWQQIGETKELQQSFQVNKHVAFSGQEGVYTVPYTGFYTLTAAGAQGGSYENYEGGKGGKVQAVFYLERGEKLSYAVGGQDGYFGGGQGSLFANGGGYSQIASERQGILLVAGGGGGASGYQDGYPGGSLAGVTDVETGQNGVAGGGGGYHGGIAAVAEIHQHIENCRHIHVGAPDCYGGCYTKPAECGSTEIIKREDRRVFYFGNIADDNSHKFCERCGSDSCPGHLDIYYKYVCESCGNSKTYQYKKCTALTGYEPDCGKSDTYICGWKEGEVMKTAPSYGGSNFVNTAVCLEYQQEAGVQEGNGLLTIVSKQVGVVDKNILLGVAATDMAPPEAIAETEIQKTAVAEDKIRVAFSKPKDKGTVYYHQVKSYTKQTGEPLCISNQTKNTLISGIVGYYYTVNQSSDTIMTERDTFYPEDGENPFLTVQILEGDSYLHIAAVDKAGNVGPTSHILISAQDIIYWPLITEQLVLESGSHVYPAKTPHTYYVKADDSTPFAVKLEGLLCGSARKEYQINIAGFQVDNLSDVSQGGVLSVLIHNREKVTAGSYTYPMSQLQKKVEGILGLQDASYTMVKRYNMCKSVTATQKFMLSHTMDGQQLRITPRVAAVGEEETVWSLTENDILHSICVIADGKGPKVTGLEELENIALAEGECLEVMLQATDDGSGLAQFYVEVRNLENGVIVRYTDETLTGKLSLLISQEDEVFQGEFAVNVYAKDHVGNETSLQNTVLQIGLSAYVERVLAPHQPVFKRGESGILHIETVGYVERVEVSFPSAFTEQDASYNRSFLYENPSYIKTEEITFVVPFAALEGEQTICVKAYKAGTELETEPELVTITVKGSILDELRTRLR